jgi:hypothetical protein
MNDLQGIIPDGMETAAAGTELTDLLYIIHGTDSLDDEIFMAKGYPADVLQCKVALIQYFYKHPEQEAEERIWALVKKKRKERESSPDEELRAIAKSSLILPARVLVYLTEEIKKRDFWHSWKKLKDLVYHDEVMKMYAPAELMEERRCEAESPVPEVTTSDFLRQDSRFLFHGTPDELKGKPDYYLSDDDRMYWWDGTDEVQISDEMDAWLKGLAQRHRQLEMILNPEPESSLDFMRNMIHLLDEINEHYERVFAFKDMFYEFADHTGEIDYRAAIELLRDLSAENIEEGKIVKKTKYNWEFCRNATHNIARLRLKRYLSVMANKKLRKLYFGF